MVSALTHQVKEIVHYSCAILRLCKCIAQSRDRTTIVRNLGILRMSNTISRLCKFDCAEHIHTVDAYALAAYPKCRCQHNCYLLYNRCACSDCPSRLSFLSFIFQAHLGVSKLAATEIKLHKNLNCSPAAIALNYSVKNIRNVHNR